MRLFFRKVKKSAAPPGKRPPREEHGRTVALQGNIAEIQLDDIFQLLNNGALTGELEVCGEKNSGSFFVRKGVLIYGLLHSSQRKIGEILVSSQAITENQLQQILGLLADAPEKRFGHILLERGLIKNDKLIEALRIQAREAFYEALSWKQGTFFFYNNRTPSEEEVLLADRVDTLLLQGMLQLDET
ncbi:MAG: hypothetical protein CSA21_06675 [Deltaproteobacteria bacterium]|nr:MAG: hypothetical protein CSA21_06675 [Deltaproteobacteria bacterium]